MRAGNPTSSLPLAPVAVTVILALLIGGVPGALILLTAAVVTAPGRRRAPAGAALGLLALAAVASVVEAPLAVSGIGLDYALDRPVAAAAGRLAGVALLVAVAIAAVTERAPSGPARSLSAQSARTRFSRRRASGLAAGIAALPYLVAATAVMVAGAVRSVVPLSPAEVVLAANLAAGMPPPSAGTPPLAAVVSAYFPVSPEAVVLAVSALVVVALMRLVRCWRGRPAVAAAGLAAAAVVGATGPGLAEALATLLVAIGLVWLCPAKVTIGRAVVAGLCLGAAVLARPEAVLTLPAALAWVSLAPPRRAGTGARVTSSLALSLAVVAAAGVVVAPWQRWLHTQGASPWAGVSADPFTWAAWAGPLVVALVAGVAERALRPGPAPRHLGASGGGAEP